MGTRGACGFYSQGTEKVTYNHYDSYPVGLGYQILQYLDSRDRDMDKIRNDFDMIQLVKETSRPSKKQVEICRNAGVSDLTVSEGKVTDWYCLLREAQGDLTQNVKAGLMIDSKEFLYDSLFCEWAYIINIDDSLLEVYKGGQKSAGEGRYSKRHYLHDSWPYDDRFYGVTLVADLDIKDVKTLDMDYIEEFGYINKIDKEIRDKEVVGELDRLINEMLI